MPVHSEETVARLLPEPDNGAVLVVKNSDDDWRIIWRDDAEAARWGSPHPTERWFSDSDSDPMELRQHVKYAQAVYALGEPVATFGGN